MRGSRCRARPAIEAAHLARRYEGSDERRFAFARVVPAYVDAAVEMKHREDLWLVAEFRKRETKYYFSTLPRSTAQSDLVRLIKERYRTEQVSTWS